MQQENEQGFSFGSHGENSWRALRGATRTSRSIPGLTSAQGLRHQLAPRAQEMEVPRGALPLQSKHECADQGVTYLESKRNNCHSYSYLFKQTGEVIITILSIFPYT